MIVRKGVLVFGELLAAQSAAEQPVLKEPWRKIADILFSVGAINGRWDQTSMYSSQKSTEPCGYGTLFCHVKNFNDPAKSIMAMERMRA